MHCGGLDFDRLAFWKGSVVMFDAVNRATSIVHAYARKQMCLARYEAFCMVAFAEAYPADTTIVVTFLQYLSATLTFSTVRYTLSVVSDECVRRGVNDPRTELAVRKTMSRLRYAAARANRDKR